MALGSDILRQLRRPLALTRLGLVAERGARAFWPLWVVAAVGFGLWLSGVVPAGAAWGTWLWAVVLAGAAVAALWGARRFRWPRPADALARLDHELAGRPLAALSDQPAIGGDDPTSQALWEAHQRRMAAHAAGARAVPPDLKLADRDPFALRHLALLFLAAVVVFGTGLGAGSALAPRDTDGAAGMAAAAWEGWAEPPQYTGRPALYLNDSSDALSLPAGTVISIRLYGESGALAVSETVSAAGSGSSDTQQSFAVTRSGRVQISGGAERSWDITVEPDAAPEVAILAAAEAQRGGTFSLPFRAADDFGVRRGQADITLDLPQVDRRYGLVPDPIARDAVQLDLPMPYGADRAEIEDALTDTLSTHPWANLPVIVRLTVQDDADQAGESAPMAMILPGKRFFEPMAAAIAEQRRDLLWAPAANGHRISQVLRAVSWQPEGVFRRPEHLETLRGVIDQIETQTNTGFSDETALQELSDTMWDLALELEEGSIENARERLRRARERLADAMRRGASPAEIAELMDELRAATDAYMDLLAENAVPAEDEIDQPDTGEDSQNVTMQQIQEMMDEIQRLMDEGRMDEAQALMEQLNQLLDNLQMQEGGDPDPSGRQRQMEELGETLRDQQDLSDEAFRDLQDRFNGRDTPSQQQQGDGSGDQTEETGQGSLADRQRALQEALDAQRQQLPGLTGEEADAARDALDRAGEAMEDAAEALERDDLPGAIDGQARALEALRDGMRSLADAFDREAEGEEGGLAEDGSTMRMPEDRDPLGRLAGRDGEAQEGVEGGALEGGDPRARAQDLLEELRRRAGELTRPEDERDYLGRLLDRF